MMNTDLAPGSVFAGRYVIGQVLGDGGYGRVFEAQDHEVGRRVALKVLRPDGPNGDYSHEKRERFRREAATVANLQDPHTVTLFDHGETPEGLLFMVFEFVNGTPLNELIKQGPVSADVASQIVRQVLQSLREAHAAGILHRDLKPENIIVHDYGDGQYRAKLVDFGLAKSTMPNGEQPLTAAGLVMGTAAYVSPEAYRLQPLSPASDIFGLGLVFYEMVVGQAANRANSAMEIATQMVDPNEFEVPYSVPEPTRTIITNMIRKDPMQRYQNATDVLAHLPESTMDSPYGSSLSGANHSSDSTRQSTPSARSQYAPPPGYTGMQQVQQGYAGAQAYGQQQGGYDPMRPPTLIEGQGVEEVLGHNPNRPATMLQPHIQHSQPHLQPAAAQQQQPQQQYSQPSYDQYSQPSYDQYSQPSYDQYSQPSYDQYNQGSQQYQAPQYQPDQSYGYDYSQGQDPYGQYSYDQYDYSQQPGQGPQQGPRRSNGGVIGFTIGLVVLLFVFSAGLIHILDIKMPWEPSGSSPSKLFDLTSTDTTFLYVDWTAGIQIAHDPGQIPAAGRCALILDSLSNPTPQGSYYVINALEPVEEQVTAYAVGPQELKLIAENCYGAASIAEHISDKSKTMNGEKKIREVEARNKQRQARRNRAREMDSSAAGGQPDLSKMFRGGGGGGLPTMIQGLLK